MQDMLFASLNETSWPEHWSWSRRSLASWLLTLARCHSLSLLPRVVLVVLARSKRKHR